MPGEPPGYTLFTAVPLRSSTNFDLLLRQNHGYDHARKLGQLRELQVVAVKDGARRFERALVARGMKAGDVKPASLHPGLFWSEVFA